VAELSNKKISIIGCGWLGFPLALDLFKKGFVLSGTARVPEKIQMLDKLGIKGFQLVLDHKNSILPPEDAELWNADVFIITLPPADAENYVSALQIILQKLLKLPQKIQIIYTSSTGIYGKNIGLVSEKTAPNPGRPSAVAVLQAEELFLKHKTQMDVCILRLAGLVGPGRAPGRFFAGKKNLSSGATPVNLVHMEDCISVVDCIIEKNIRNGIFNVCADKHPTHREFYPAQAIKMGLEAPEYNADSSNEDMKIIDNSLLKKSCDYLYLFPDPMEFTY
jgi:nucleoside-diphosphate-sugar epimerase